MANVIDPLVLNSTQLVQNGEVILHPITVDIFEHVFSIGKIV